MRSNPLLSMGASARTFDVAAEEEGLKQRHKAQPNGKIPGGEKEKEVTPPVYDMGHPDMVVSATRVAGKWGWTLADIAEKIPRIPSFPGVPKGFGYGWLQRNLNGKSWRVTSQRPLSWLEQIYDFTQDTTFHGIRFIFDADNILFRRLLWFVTIVGLIVPFSIIVRQAILDLNSGDTIDIREIKYEASLVFPAVTICNHNRFRTSVAAAEDFYTALTNLFGNASNVDNSTRERLQLGNVTLDMANLAHQEEDLVYRCEWQGKHCDEYAFTRLINDEGICYTFNGDPANPLTTENEGATYGLSLVFNVEQYEYMAGPSNTAAVRVIIHKASNVVDPTDNGIDVPPGYHASVGISETKISTAGGNNKCEAKSLRYWQGANFREYTANACNWECESDYIDEVCLCHRVQIPIDPRIFNNQTLRPCSLYDKYQCVDPSIARYKDGSSGVPFQCVTDCNQTCSSSTYNPVLSYSSLSRYNAEKILDEEVNKIQKIRTNFQNAREYNARFNQKATMSDQRLFQDIDEIFTRLERLDIMPNETAVAALGQRLLDISCFTNARAIVETYKEFVSAGVAELQSLDVFAFRRSLFLRSFRSNLDSMGVRARNFQRLIDLQLARWTKASAEELANQVNFERLGNMRFLTSMSQEIVTKSKNLEDYVKDNYFLRNISSFNAQIAALPQMQSEVLACFASLNRSLDATYTRLRDQIGSGSVTRNGASESLDAWLGAERRCEALLVDYFGFDREIWKAALGRALQGIIAIPDITITGSRDIQRDFHRFQRQFQTVELTKLQLAEEVTGNDFVDKVEYFVSFMLLVNRFLFDADAAISNYMRDFGNLNNKIPEVIRELYSKEHETEYNLYFRDNLFTSFEVEHCMENQTRAIVSELRKELQTSLTSFQSTWTQLRSQMSDYKDNSILNADFVLTNFAQVDIFFRDMRLEEVNKQMQFGFSAFVSLLGGNCGLYFGASFLTLAELIDLLFYTTFKKYMHRRHQYLQKNELQIPSNYIGSQFTT